MKRLYWLLSLLLAVVNAGCTININTPSFSRQQREQSNRVEVRLDQNGVMDPRFLEADPPQILRPGHELFLTTKEENLGFDVTFVLLVPLPEVRPMIPKDTKPEDMGRLFADSLEEKYKGIVTEVQCRILPRCEVTFTVPAAENAENPGTLQVPTQILELDASTATPFQILRIEPGSTSEPEDDKYVDVENRIGFLTTENKPASARIRVPLDNTGIADWAFLNPRLPRVLPIGAFELPQQPSAPAAAEGENAKTAIAYLNTLLPGPVDRPDPSTEIRELAIAALREIDRVDRLKVTDRGADPNRRSVDQSIKTILNTAEGVIRRIGRDLLNASATLPVIGNAGLLATCPAIQAWPEGDTTTFNVQTGADRVREMAVVSICSTAKSAIETSASDEERTAILSVSRSAIQALGSAAQITPEMDVPTTKADRKKDVERIEYAKALIERINQENTESRGSLTAVNGANADAGVRRSLKELVGMRISDRLTGLKAEADTRASTLNEQIQETVQRQQRVRFLNETVDRHFVITLELSRQKLLNAFTDPACPTGKDQDACKLRLIQQARYDNSVDLAFSSDTSVTVTLTVPPGSPADIDAWLLSKAPKAIVPFNVDFFDQTDDPAYSRGYIALQEINPADASVQPDSKFTSNLIAGLTTLYDPCLGGTECSGSLTDSTPYNGELKRHSKGRGQLDLSQNLGSRADAKLSLLYEANDFGQSEVDGTNDPVRVSQFQINVFGTTGLILSLGKFTFAEPSNKIAISESGEGLRLTWRYLAFSYITKRESNLGTANDHDKDREALLGEVTGPIRGTSPLRRFRLTALWGEDRCKQQRLSTPPDPPDPGTVINGECKDATGSPYTYATFGGELFFNVRADKTPEDLLAGRTPLTGSIAAYGSHRDARLAGAPNGEGYVGLLTLGLPHKWVPEKKEEDPQEDPKKVAAKKLKPRRIFTTLVGYGSGDEADSKDVDEGYVGEGATFANDLIFLSGMAMAIRKGSLSNSGDDLTRQEWRRIGVGLSNKAYVGLQYTFTDSSPLEWVAIEVFNGDKRDIVSQSSTLSVHGYRFIEPIFGDRDAGYELNADLRIEQPQHVKWRMTVGYFFPGDALKDLVKKETWTASMGVVIEPAKLF